MYRDSVHYSLPEYRIQRQWTIEAKHNLNVKDRIIKRFRDTLVPAMDTTITILRQRVQARDSLLTQKDQTIKSLSRLNGKAFSTPIPWITGLVGLVFGILLTR